MLALLELREITKVYSHGGNPFAPRREAVKAVDAVSLSLAQGKTLGLVGESGCGKSTLAKIILKLVNSNGGTVWFDGRDIGALPEKEFRPLRKEIQIVFQDPAGSLSPRLRVRDIIAEPLEAFGVGRKERGARIKELMAQVGLPEEYLSRLPLQLSGGERQRVGIARALATSPKLLVLDEAVSSLDLSTQAQILNLLVFLQRTYGLTYLFIAHNLSVVRYISDEIAVMYRGVIVEKGPAASVFDNPAHPYTRLLLSSIPGLPDRRGKNNNPVPGSAEPVRGEHGCCFYAACPAAREQCRLARPVMREVEKEHWASCPVGSEGKE